MFFNLRLNSGNGEKSNSKNYYIFLPIFRQYIRNVQVYKIFVFANYGIKHGPPGECTPEFYATQHN